MDARTGEQKVRKRSGVESIWATPLVGDGKLYLFGRRGETSIIDLATHEISHENLLWEVEQSPADQAERPYAAMGGHTVYAAAFSNGRLLLRRGDKLFAILNK